MTAAAASAAAEASSTAAATTKKKTTTRRQKRTFRAPSASTSCLSPWSSRAGTASAGAAPRPLPVSFFFFSLPRKRFFFSEGRKKEEKVIPPCSSLLKQKTPTPPTHTHIKKNNDRRRRRLQAEARAGGRRGQEAGEEAPGGERGQRGGRVLGALVAVLLSLSLFCPLPPPREAAALSLVADLLGLPRVQEAPRVAPDLGDGGEGRGGSRKVGCREKGFFFRVFFFLPRSGKSSLSLTAHSFFFISHSKLNSTEPPPRAAAAPSLASPWAWKSTPTSSASC